MRTVRPPKPTRHESPSETSSGPSPSVTDVRGWAFVDRDLTAYADDRHDPDDPRTSGLSPYLHFGHVSAHEVFDAVMTHEGWTRRKLAPAISPGKTWEGAAGGLIGAAAYAMILSFILAGAQATRMAAFVGAAALLVTVGIVGDLFESAAKRQAGVKDSGALLPGHGGVLDRIDSATAILPVAALVVPFLKSTP